MFYWIIYDISEDKKRNKIARICKNYGCARVQKSSFACEITKNKLEMLEIECKKLLEGTDDYLFILPACSSCFERKRIVTGFLDEKKFCDLDFVFLGGSE